jgi:hypothetical protein
MHGTEQWIVVEDPEGHYFEGSLVDAGKAQQLERRGVALLPVNPELFRQSGAGGYFKRAWGSGWPLDALHPKIHAPVVLFCDPDHVVLHWMARLTATPEFLNAGGSWTGQLQIAVDTSQRTPFHAGLTDTGTAVSAKDLGTPDRDGGWTVRGRGTISCRTEGHHGFALYGYAPGLRVLWVAVSVTQEMNRL